MGRFHGRKLRDPIGSSDAHIIGPEFSRVTDETLAKDPIVFGYVLPVDGLVDVLEQEHPGAFDVVDDDDVVHRHVRRRTPSKIPWTSGKEIPSTSMLAVFHMASTSRRFANSTAIRRLSSSFDITFPLSLTRPSYLDRSSFLETVRAHDDRSDVMGPRILLFQKAGSCGSAKWSWTTLGHGSSFASWVG